MKTTKKPSETQPYNKVESRVALGSTEQVMMLTTFCNPKPDEVQAVRYAEGLYDRSFMTDVANKEEILTFLAHFADMIAAQVVEWHEPWTRDHQQWRSSLALSGAGEEVTEVAIQGPLFVE